MASQKVTVTNLDSLPENVTVTVTNGTRTGNTISCSAEKLTFRIQYDNADAVFAIGSIVEISLNVTAWSQASLRCFARGRVPSGWNAGLANWEIVEGMAPASGSPIGLDANTSVKTNATGTIILRIVFVAECRGFYFSFSPVGRDWAVANGTGTFEFLYLTTETQTPDPYEQGGTSTGNVGGGGTFDPTSDPISIPALPTISAADAGFITLFNPSISELNALAAYMWTDSLFDVANFQKIFANPMDAILGLAIVPVAVPNGASRAVKVGNISTGVTMTVAAQQYVEVDCGTLTIPEFWGGYLDYEPYTRLQIYLPYIGIHSLSADDCIGKALHVVYHVDILSGACVAYIQCEDSVLYSFAGSCSSSIPITGDNFTNMINGGLSIAAAIGSMVATGGASAPLAAPSAAGTAARLAATASIATTATNSLKPEVQKSGSLGGTAGMLAGQKPYVIITRPRQALPENQNLFVGYPSFVTMLLNDVEGFTVVESCHLENVPATEAELSEIEQILQTGVIF